LWTNASEDAEVHDEEKSADFEHADFGIVQAARSKFEARASLDYLRFFSGSRFGRGVVWQACCAASGRGWFNVEPLVAGRLVR
jgi:hypothetical protein